jgi:hypothetical protein
LQKILPILIGASFDNYRKGIGIQRKCSLLTEKQIKEKKKPGDDGHHIRMPLWMHAS